MPTARPKIGRPERAPLFYDSMRLASAALGVDYKILRRAKDAACSAFRNNRINRAEIREWLDRYPDGAPEGFDAEAHEPTNGKTSIDYRLKEVKAQREEVKLAREKGMLLDRDAVYRGIRAASAKLMATLEREFAAELPPVLKGLDEISIRRVVLERLARLEAVFRKDVGL